MKIIVLSGSPLALPALRHFFDAGQLSALICPSDSVADDASSLEDWANENGLPCWKIEKDLLHQGLAELVNETSPDLVLVYAFPHAMPLEVLQNIKYGCWNIHFSLQPENKGCITIHQLAETTGDQVLHQCSLNLLSESKYGSSLHQLSLLAVELLQVSVVNARTKGFIDNYFCTVA